MRELSCSREEQTEKELREAKRRKATGGVRQRAGTRNVFLLAGVAVDVGPAHPVESGGFD
jgi:hypothetical protein